jgi:MFS family permease
MTASTRQSSPVEPLRQPLFLWSLPFIFLYFGLPVIGKSLGASALEIGGLFSIFTATTLLLRPIVGWAIDRLGRKQFFVAALMIYALAMGIFAFTESLSWLFLARFVQGIGSAFLWIAVFTIVADLTSPGERGRAMGQLNEITARGGLVGIFAAFIAMTLLPEGLGWKVAFSGFAILTFASAWLAWKYVPTTKPAQRNTLDKSIVSRQLFMLLVLVFVSGVPEAMLSPIYLTYLQDKFTTDITSLAWAFFPAGLVTAFLSSRLGALSDRYGRAWVMAAGLAGAGIISLLMPSLPSLMWLAVLYTLSAVSWSLSEPAETAMVADLAGEDRRGFAYGLYDFVESLGFTIGPLLGGLMYDAIGKDTPFYLNGVILLISAVWVFLFLNRTTAKKSLGPSSLRS